MAGTEIAYTTRDNERFAGYLAVPDSGGRAAGKALRAAVLDRFRAM